MAITYCRLGFNRYGCESWKNQFNPCGELNKCGLARQVWPSRPASALMLHTQAESGAHSDAPPLAPTLCDGVHLYRQRPSGQCRVYQVTQLHTDGVHRQEFARTGPVGLKVVRVTGCCLSRNVDGPIFVLSHTHYWNVYADWLYIFSRSQPGTVATPARVMVR